MSFNNANETWEEEIDINDQDYIESLVDRLPQPLTVDDFDWKLKLVSGSYGQVSLCISHALGKTEPVCIKAVKKVRIWNNKQVSQVLRERSLCYELQHPFIVRFGGCFQDPKTLYFITEYCPGGDLFYHLRRLTCLRQGPTTFYVACLVAVLDYLHNEKSIVFRDLKPENILIDRDGYIKLTDFGLSKKLDYKTYTFCGTPEYIAPEIIKMMGHDFGVDWWSLGCKIRIPSTVSTEAKDFCKRLLRVNPSNRLGCSYEGVEKVRKHQIFKGLKWESLVSKKLGGKEGAIVPKVSGNLDTKAFLNKSQRNAQENEKNEKERKDKLNNGNDVDNKKGTTKLGEAEWEGGIPPWGDEFNPFEIF